MYHKPLARSNSLWADAPVLGSVSPPANFLARYNRYFRTQFADTPEMIRTAQYIRYQVYCLERKFENAEEHASGLESDAFDPVAIHSLVLHSPTSKAIGTARLILPNHTAGGLPVQRLLQEGGFRIWDHFPVETTAELSRLAISKHFRSRCSEASAEDDTRRTGEITRVLPLLGLLQDLLRQSIRLGLTHWAAVLEPKLLRMLAAMGFYSTPVGPLVSHHGLRQPSYCHLSDMLERLRRERPDHWMVVTDAGTLIPAASIWHCPAHPLVA